MPTAWTVTSQFAPKSYWDDAGTGGRRGSFWAMNSCHVLTITEGHDKPDGAFYDIRSGSKYLNAAEGFVPLEEKQIAAMQAASGLTPNAANAVSAAAPPLQREPSVPSAMQAGVPLHSEGKAAASYGTAPAAGHRQSVAATAGHRPAPPPPTGGGVRGPSASVVGGGPKAGGQPQPQAQGKRIADDDPFEIFAGGKSAQPALTQASRPSLSGARTAAHTRTFCRFTDVHVCCTLCDRQVQCLRRRRSPLQTVMLQVLSASHARAWHAHNS